MKNRRLTLAARKIPWVGDKPPLVIEVVSNHEGVPAAVNPKVTKKLLRYVTDLLMMLVRSWVVSCYCFSLLCHISSLSVMHIFHFISI